METKRTELTNHYWNKNGAYQKELDELYALVPDSGCADSLAGELVRAVNRLYYDFCNNGNCNACEVRDGEEVEVECPYCGGCGYLDDEDDVCDECGGSGVIYEEGEQEVEIATFYDNMIELIQTTLSEAGNKEIVSVCENIRTIILNMPYCGNARYTSDDNMHVYDLLADHVAEYVLQHEDSKTQEVPSWYGNKD